MAASSRTFIVAACIVALLLVMVYRVPVMTGAPAAQARVAASGPPVAWRAWRLGGRLPAATFVPSTPVAGRPPPRRRGHRSR